MNHNKLKGFGSYKGELTFWAYKYYINKHLPANNMEIWFLPVCTLLNIVMQTGRDTS